MDPLLGGQFFLQDRTPQSLNTQRFMQARFTPDRPQTGTSGGDINIGRTTTGEVSRIPGAPGINMPDTMNRVMQYIGNTPQVQNAPDMEGLLASTTTTGDFAGDVKVQQTFLTRPWVEPSTGYEKYLLNGDLLVLKKDDEMSLSVPINNSTNPVAVLPFSVFNHLLYMRRRDAFKQFTDFMKINKRYVNNFEECDFMVENLITHTRVVNHMRLIENMQTRNTELKAREVMKNMVQVWEDEVKTLSEMQNSPLNGAVARNPELIRNMNQALFQEMRQAYDNYNLTVFNDINRLYHGLFIYLDPTLIRLKFEFIGMQQDSMLKHPIHRSSYGKVPVATFLNDGPEWVTNIFGNSSRTAHMKRRMRNEYNLPTINSGGTNLSVVLTEHLPKWVEDIVYSKGRPDFSPIWAMPVFGITKDHLVTDLEQTMPQSKQIRHGTPDALPERWKLTTTRMRHYTEPISWSIGRVRQVSVMEEKPKTFFVKAWGIKNYDIDAGIDDVLECRNAVGHIEIDFGNSN